MNEPDVAPYWLRVVGAWSWRIIGAAVALGILGWLVVQLQVVAIAIFLGLVLGAVLMPLADFYRRRVPGVVAAALAVLTGGLAVSALLAFVSYSVMGQWSTVLGQVEAGLGELLVYLDRLPFEITVTPEDIAGWGDTVSDWVVENQGAIAGGAIAQLGTLARWGIILGLSFFTAVCLLATGKDMWAWFLRQLPERSRDGWRVAVGAGWGTFGAYTRGALTLSLWMAGLSWLLLLVLRVPMAEALAVLVFIGGFIPLIGAPLAMSIAMVVALATNGLWSAVFVGIGIALLGQLEGNVLQPLIMGKRVSLHPFVVGVVVTAGTVVAGFAGAIVAVPATGVAWAVFSSLRRHYGHAPEDRLVTPPPASTWSTRVALRRRPRAATALDGPELADEG